MLLYLLSPAKTLDYSSEVPGGLPSSMPRFLGDSEQLVNLLQAMSADDLMRLMGVSEKIATLNESRFRAWKVDYGKKEARQAILAFKGGVYQGLAVEDWAVDDFTEAQQCLRILSGLYGVLRPLDLMMPYRLEMGKKLANQRGVNLYQFWGSLLTNSLNEDLSGSEDAVINLASKEYFTSVKTKELIAPVITPVFKDWKNGQFKVISFFAKKARGRMAAWAIQKQIKLPEDLKQFDVDGYVFNDELSDELTYVFLRK